MRNVIVTGGSGFIGSHLVGELIAQGYHVIVPYVDVEKQSFFLQRGYDRKVTLEKLDIRSKKRVFAFVKKFTPDFIFHLAAVTLVTDAYRNPLETFETNIMGTAYFLESIRIYKNIKGIIVASTDKAYGKTEKTYMERSPLKGDHPYDVSKSSADLISQTYVKTYKTPVIITRFGNVYGEGDLHFDRIIPGICEAIIKRKKLIIRSDGTYVRDYLYVKDVVDGYMFLFKNFKKLNGEAFNFSSSDTYSVLELIKKIASVLQEKVSYEVTNTAKNEIPYQHLNDDKIKKIGWKNNYIIETTIKKVLEWYKSVL